MRAVGNVVREVWNLWPESEDLEQMRSALEQARLALQNNEVPIGAVVVWDGEVLAEAHNQVEQQRNATAHAELLALQQALHKRHSKVLPGATVYVTLEPCPMCFGALVEAQVRRVVYAVENLKAGAVTVHRMKPPSSGKEAGSSASRPDCCGTSLPRSAPNPKPGQDLPGPAPKTQKAPQARARGPETTQGRVGGWLPRSLFW